MLLHRKYSHALRRKNSAKTRRYAADCECHAAPPAGGVIGCRCAGVVTGVSRTRR